MAYLANTPFQMLHFHHSTQNTKIADYISIHIEEANTNNSILPWTVLRIKNGRHNNGFTRLKKHTKQRLPPHFLV